MADRVGVDRLDQLATVKDTWFRDWMLPASGVALLVPFFLMSWWIEAPIVAWILDDLPVRFVDFAVRDANLVTYGLLAALLCLPLVLILREPQATGERKTVSKRQVAEERVKKIAVRQRDIVLRHQLRPMHSIGLHESWRIANDHAKRGMISLRAAENRIDRKRIIHALADVRNHYDASEAKVA